MRRISTIVTISILSTALIALPLPAQLSPVPPGFLGLPQNSVAVTDDALSLLVNPAGLGVPTGGSAYLLAPYMSKGDFGDWGFSLGGEGLGFAAEYMKNGLADKRNRYTWGMGFGAKGSYFGFAYSWTSGLNRQNTWDVGYLSRPMNFVSTGIVARGLNNPRYTIVNPGSGSIYNIKQNVGWDIGLAVRPFALFVPIGNKWGENLTISFDAYLREIDPVGPFAEERYGDNTGYKIGAILDVVPGLTVNFDYKTIIDDGVYAADEMISAGLTFNFGNQGAGVLHDGEHDGMKSSGVAWMSQNDLYRQTWPKVKQKKYVEIVLRGPIVEYQSTSSIFSPRYRTLYKFIRQLDKLADDPDVAGIILRLEGYGAGWAKTQEMRKALSDFRAYSGKRIIVYAESCGNGSYYLASAADKIYINPSGDVGLNGLKAHMVFVKNSLDKLGIDPELEHIGKYKSASEMLTREDMSEGQREATDFILDGLFDDFVADIADGRGIAEDELIELIDNGPYNAKDAEEAGLIDGLIYEDQISDMIEELEGEELSIIKEKKKNRQKEAKTEWFDFRKKSVAIVYGVGAITSGGSGGGGIFAGESMGSKTLAKAIRAARNNPEVAAIVFRVNSPGGSGLASDVILREVELCTEGDDAKPIIVSMSDVAGSGGYFVACKADTIVADPGTITGSIGVVTGKLAYHRLQEKMGVNTATLKRGKFADMYEGYRSFTDEEWEKVRYEINEFYQSFLQKVADGRDMDTSEVNKVAQGRIWTGRQAKDIGLVDVTGGLDVAIELAARAGGIDDGESFNVKMYPSYHGWEFMGEMETAVQSLALKVVPEPLLETMNAITEQTRWKEGEMLYLMPYKLEIE